MQYVLLVVLLGGLIGCASQKVAYTPTNARNASATLEDFQRDLAECAKKTSPGWALLSPWVYLGLSANEGARELGCMEARGWQGSLPPTDNPRSGQ